MSTSGQGDQNMEIDKDNESEITSTTSDNGGAPQNCVTEIKTLSEAVAADAERHVESKYEGSSLEAINDDVEDSTIDSYVTTESKNDKDKTHIDDAEVVCGKISPHIPPGRDIEVILQKECQIECSSLEAVNDDVEDSAIDSYVTTESKKDKDKPLIDDAEVVCGKISPHIPPGRDIEVTSQQERPDDDDVVTDSAIDSYVTTESKKDKDKPLIDDAEVVGGKISPPRRDIEVISQRECPNDEPDFSKNTSDKDSCSLSEDLELKWDEDDIDEAVLTDDVKKNQDIEHDESDKSTIDETAQLIQKLDLVIEESKNDINDDKIESNQSSDQIIENQNSGVDNIKQKVETLSSNNEAKDKISPSIEDNKIDDIEMTSTSFDSQDIIDEIDNITEDDKIGDMIASCIEELDVLVDIEAPKCEEPNVLVHTETPNEEMDIETISTDHVSKNVESIAEIKLQSPKQEEKMDIEIEAETPIESVELSIDEKDNTEKCEIVENEIPILKEKDTKEGSLVDTTDNLTKEKSDVDAKDVESKDSVLSESANQIEDKSEIPNEPNVSLSTEVPSVDDSKTEDSQTKESETIETKDDQTNENDRESESVPIEDSIGDSDIAGTITPNIHHRINKPNVMLDIPTQELSDIEAELDDDDLDYTDSVDKTLDDKKVDNSLKTDIIDTEMAQLNDDKIVLENVSDETVTVTSPTIVIDATSSILNIKTFSISEELKSGQEIPSTSKLDEITTKSDEITSKSIEITSKSDEITSKSDEITSKSEQSIDNEITTPKAEETNEDITSNTTQEISENLLKEKIIEDPKLAEANVDDKNMHIDEQPSTSKPEATLESPDTDDLHELSDSLGLLAESSRVMDDDDDGEDAEDQEVDENDDEDFDPYDETNSEIAEDMEDSNTPPPELFPKLHKPGDKLSGRESDEETMEVQETTMDIVDDIECDENDLELDIPDDTISEIQLDEVSKNQPEIIDADMHKEEDKTGPPEKIINILEKVLGSQISTDVQEVSKTPELESVSPKETVSGSVAVPKTPTKVSKINTDEVSIKTASASTTPLHIPETTIDPKPTTKPDEIFNLDSDDDEAVKKETTKEEVTEDIKVPKEESPKTEKKCINPSCNSGIRTYYPVDRTTAAYYSLTRRTALVCEPCRRRADERSEALINGIKDLRPLLELDMDAPSQQLVEISDSDSDGEGGACDTDGIGEKGATFLEEHLADMINETWNKYKMESRLKNTEMYLLSELDKIEANAKEINDMLDECQRKTDAIRVDFYKDYELRRKNVGAIVIHDTPFSSYSHVEKDVETPPVETFGSRYPKRRAASMANDTPAKRPAIPMGYTPLDGDKMMDSGESRADDDKEDISVVKLSAESAPADLPPPGEIVRPPLKVGMTIYAMRNAFGTWLKGKIMDVQPKASGQQFSQCRVKFEHKVKNPCKVLAGRCLAYPEPSTVRMTIGTRVVALFKDPQNPARRESFYGGVIAEIPNPVNSYRYLVFFDDGYAQYVHHQDTRIVCESSNLVWEEVHQFIRDFIYKYLLSYPERPMVRLHAGEKLKTEWNGKWWDSKVLKVDASIALISFDEDNRTEWIYRGSTRLAPLYLELQAARAGEGKGRSRLPRNKAHMRSNMPCVEYTRSDEQPTTRATAESQQQNEEMRRQRAVAKKSTTQMLPPTLTPGTNYEGVISRVVYYTPKNAVKPYKMSPHTCSVNCRRSDLLSMKDLRTYNPLAKPLLSGWERQTVRYKGNREVVYRAPCGRRLRNMFELHKYLRILQSDMSVDLFDFTPGTHCLAEFVLSKCNVSKKDLSHGKENVPVPCVNYYDTSLPEFCSYNTERTPTAGVPLNIDPEFLCGCDCTDDCIDKTKCACWKMTLEGARTVGLEGMNVGYVYRRLPEPLPSGIYECNSRCKCKQTCLNRVAQHPLQLKLQVFKTINRGWGIRALNDVPKGSFLCVYAGNLLTDATANLDGLNEGDEYLAELDYIEVVEAMKEGYEDDIPEKDKKLDKKGSSSASESEPTSESEEEQDHTKRDGDFQPGFLGFTNPIFKKSLRKREKAKKKEEEKQKEEANKQKKDDCITISDDEEVREPSRFTAEAGMVDKDLISKHSSRVSVRTLFGKDEACYIMDAKVQGNIGRYLNHSCHPNVFVQNVFVDTHDPRFPWVAFFALSHVRAGTELTWNYNYDVGSVPEKVLYCYCGAANCRGRLL